MLKEALDGAKEVAQDRMVNLRLAEIVRMQETDVSPDVDLTERAMPGFAKYISSGWSRFMLERYLMATHLSEGRTVIDSCCGLGWGSYLVAARAAHVTGVDSSRPCIDLARRWWKPDRLDFTCQDILLFSPVHQVDLVLAMESVEHFAEPQIREYIALARRWLKPGGILVGSTMYVKDETTAKRVERQNPHHRHICTHAELQTLLAAHFTGVEMPDGRYFMGHA